jgi:hypothetical protein
LAQNIVALGGVLNGLDQFEQTIYQPVYQDRIPQGEPYPYSAQPAPSDVATPNAVDAPAPYIVAIPAPGSMGSSHPMTAAEVQQLQYLSKNQTSLSAPVPPQLQTSTPSQPAPQYVPPGGSTFPSANNTSAEPPAAVPGGISLSLAAAMQMRFALNFETVTLKSGRIIVSGARDPDSTLDAAIFLTALRLACEPDGDPYFSLDPEDGHLWKEEGDRLSQDVWSRIQDDFEWNATKDWEKRSTPGLNIRAVSARVDYPAIWRQFAPNYPDLRTRLVFHPVWLRETRVGEILYKADVLLKELAMGVPAVEAGPLRAASVNQYVSADARSVAQTLLANFEQSKNDRLNNNRLRTYRLWFDLIPLANVTTPMSAEEANVYSSTDSSLRAILRSKGFVNTSSTSDQPTALVAENGIFDLSAVYPKMFVRMHDYGTNTDIPGDAPNLDALALDVNRRIDNYMRAYKELRALTDVFRAYVAAVAVVKQASQVCGRLRSVSLLGSERTPVSLPVYHQTELGITVGTYVYADGSQKTRLIAQASSFNGGISLRGKSLLQENLREGYTTPAIERTSQALNSGDEKAIWSGGQREHLAFTIDKGELLPELSHLNANQDTDVQRVLEIQRRAQQAVAMRKQELVFDRARQLRSEQEKVQRLQEAERKKIDRELADKLGRSIDDATAAQVLPYARMAKDVYFDHAQLATDVPLRRIAEWDVVLRDACYSETQIDLIKRSGFYAAIYEDQGENITIAYRGNQASSAEIGKLDIQLSAAVQLGLASRRRWPHNSLTLTGHAFGGSLAVFASERVGILKVVTFNTVAPLLVRSTNPQRISIAWVNRQIVH